MGTLKLVVALEFGGGIFLGAIDTTTTSNKPRMSIEMDRTLYFDCFHLGAKFKQTHSIFVKL